MKKLLFISNGHGEDTIGAYIIKELLKNTPELEIAALPIVGDGSPYENLGIKILGPRKNLPSGGFLYQSFKLILKDIAAGLIQNSLWQIGLALFSRKKYDLVFGIGDIVPIVLSVLTGCPFMFHGSAKTAYYDYNYTPQEKWLLKKFCSLTFPRDQKTHEMLITDGIKSEYVGNPMMDCLEITGADFGIPKENIVIGLLPGTRQDINLNIEDLIKVSYHIQKLRPKDSNVTFLLALRPTSHVPRPTSYPLSLPADLDFRPIQGQFGDLLNRSNIVIGLSGTGNEQAVGLGKPLVTFIGRGVQHTETFAKMKQQLFGEAATLVEREPKSVAAEVWNILNDPEKIKRMQAVGRERMGVPGAVKSMADIILKEIGI